MVTEYQVVLGSDTVGFIVLVQLLYLLQNTYFDSSLVVESAFVSYDLQSHMRFGFVVITLADLSE